MLDDEMKLENATDNGDPLSFPYYILSSLWSAVVYGCLSVSKILPHNDAMMKLSLLLCSFYSNISSTHVAGMVPHPVASASSVHQPRNKAPQGGHTCKVAVEELEAKFWGLLQPMFAPPTNDETPVVTQEELGRLKGFAESIWNLYSKKLTGVSSSRQPNQRSILETGQECNAPYPLLGKARPFHDPTDYAWPESITENAPVILAEFDSFLISSPTTASSWKASITELCVNTSGFSKLSLINEDGIPTVAGQEHFPRTLHILKSFLGHDLAPRPMNINCQFPSTGLAPHSDQMNFLLTCHLGLVLPKAGRCLFQMGTEQQRQWERGKLVIADTSFIHSTLNESEDENRYILSFDIWHPSLSDYERSGILRIHYAMQKLDHELTDVSKETKRLVTLLARQSR